MASPNTGKNVRGIDHFARELFEGQPEPWESLSSDRLQPYIHLLSEYWHRTDYDHAAWFYGTRDLPRWLGYSAGFNLVSHYLATAPHLRASMLAATEAAAFSAFIPLSSRPATA